MVCNVFLSFTTEDKASANLFRSQAKAREPSLVFRDYSIKEAFEYTWKKNAARLIGTCSATVCLISKTTHRSEAVNWEVRRSAELGKRVMGVTIEPIVPIVPSALAELNVELLRWDVDTEKIIGVLNDIEVGYSRTRTIRTSRIHHTTERSRSFGTVLAIQAHSGDLGSSRLSSAASQYLLPFYQFPHSGRDRPPCT